MWEKHVQEYVMFRYLTVVEDGQIANIRTALHLKDLWGTLVPLQIDVRTA